MAEARASARMPRPAHEVIALVADPGNDPRWREEVLASVADGDGGWHQEMQVGGRDISVRVRVTVVVPGERVELAVDDPVTARGSYVAVADGEGCELHFSMTLRSGGLRSFFDGPIAAAVERTAPGNLARLAALLAAGPA
ncbi:MAG: SRPBCC family protein [Thermoleophilia bacterium]|jgi:hypothetical protein|nr:SRPBCC family protein [Thermoleophilia bacterium]